MDVILELHAETLVDEQQNNLPLPLEASSEVYRTQHFAC